MVQKRWLFVNKTSKSECLSRSNEEETSHIFSHAQRGQRMTTAVKVLSRSESCDTTCSIKRTRPSQCRSKPDAVVTHSPNAVAGAKPMPSRYPLLQEICVSSFDAFPTQHYLEFVLSRASKSSKPLALPTRSMDRHALQQISALASTDSLVSGAVLCTVTTSLQRADYREENAVAAIVIKDATLRRLRARLASTNPGSKLTKSLGLAAYAISLLLWVECVEGNTFDAQAHLSGLEHIVRLIEPASIPVNLLATVLSVSYLCCALTGRPPTLLPQLSTVVNRSILKLDLPAATIATFAPLFEDPLVADVLDPVFANVVSQHRRMLTFYDVYATGDDNFDLVSEDDMGLILETKLICWHTLLQFMSDPDISPWQEATAIALYAMDQPIASNLGSLSACCQVLGKRIIRALSKIEIDREQVSLNKLRLWLLVLAAHLLTTGPKCAEMIVSQFSELCSLLGVRTLDDLHSVLRGFFYEMPDLDRTVGILWLAFI